MERNHQPAASRPQLPTARSVCADPSALEVVGANAALLDLLQQRLVELITLRASLALQLPPLLPLVFKAALGLWILCSNAHASAAGQLEHGLLKAQVLAVLEPTDGVCPLAADKAVHPVALGTHRQRRPPVVMPGAAGHKVPARLTQFCGGKEINDLGALAHAFQKSRSHQMGWMAARGPTNRSSRRAVNGSAAPGHRHSTPG